MLLEHRGSTPPLSAESVQRLVAGGVAGLLPTDVAVVMISPPRPRRGRPPASSGTSAPSPWRAARCASCRARWSAWWRSWRLLAAATLVLYARLTRARAEAARPPARHVIRVAGLTKSVHQAGGGRRTILRDVSLTVPDGCLYGLIGPGASGKSVLLKMMTALMRPDRGTIQVGDDA